MYFRFHKDATIFIVILSLLTVFFYFIAPSLSILSLLILLFVFYFFRDPERVTPSSESVLVSPADGLITNISEFKDKNINYTKVSIFLSVFDVHIQRIPCNGKILKVDYFEGKFLNATLDKSSEENERLTITISHKNKNIFVTQIAGLIARRIVCNLSKNDSVEQGKKYGLIKFGSRVDISFPSKSYRCLVAKGQRTIGGETLLAITNLPKEKINYLAS